MSEGAERHHLVRGVLAGVAGGLAASWVMDQFLAGPGPKLTETLESQSEKQQAAEQQKQQEQSGEPQEDATMKAAEGLSETFAGKQLSYEQKKKAGPVVHYAFGGLMGGLYGALAEYSGIARSGFGTTFGAALFAGGDLFMVPVLELGPSPTEESPAQLASPFVAHLVYGATTELVRRIVRPIL